MSTRWRCGLVAMLVTVVALVAWRIADWMASRSTPITVDLAFTSAAEEAWAGTSHLVFDERSGHRARRGFAHRFENAPLAAPAAIEQIVRNTCAQGLVRDPGLGATVPGPRVLVLGDDQTMGGVAASDNWTARLEAALRASPGGFATATVLNAACDDYGLFHYVLCGPPLVARYAPRIVVVAISTGDDAVALDDRRLPHVADGGFPTGPTVPPVAEPLAISARAQRLAPDHIDLASRGLAQAAYLAESPDRRAHLDRKTRECIPWLRELAPRSGLLCVLIPPADLARPVEVAPLLSDQGRALLATDVQRRAHGRIVAALQDLGVAHVDLLPALSAAPGADVYRTDGRLGKVGHRIAAEHVLPRVMRMLELL